MGKLGNAASYRSAEKEKKKKQERSVVLSLMCVYNATKGTVRQEMNVSPDEASRET